MLNPNHTQNGAQIIYFSHGGGPLPILGDASHKAMVEFMRELPSRLKKPDAILVISAHWEESTATLLGAQAPSMVYDYYGFPDEAYEITYPAPGYPDLANRIAGLLNQNGIPARVDPQRGFDHGLYIPLKLIASTVTFARSGSDYAFSPWRGIARFNPREYLGDRIRIFISQHAGIFVAGSGYARSGKRCLSGLADRGLQWPTTPGRAGTAPDRVAETAFCPLLSPARGASAAAARVCRHG
jgi:hypothetical protein